jgi:hypothetical protein
VEELAAHEPIGTNCHNRTVEVLSWALQGTVLGLALCSAKGEHRNNADAQ